MTPKKTLYNKIVDENGEVSYFHSYGCPTCFSTLNKKHRKILKGEEHPNWKGGISKQRNKEHDSGTYNEWREQVMQLSNFRCILTGNTNVKELESHHLVSWIADPSLRYEPSNGVMLDKKVHDKFHSEYEHPATKEKFEHFCAEHYPGVVLPWQSSVKKQIISKEAIRKRRERFQEEILELIQKRGYNYVEGNYENKSSLFTIYCPIHNEISVVKAIKFKTAIFGAYCCARKSPNIKPPSQKGKVRSQETIEKRKLTLKAKYTENLHNVTKSRNHSVVSGEYNNRRHSIFELRCNIHQQTFSLSYSKYCKNPCGLPCCSSSESSSA
jgi:hypothetical protein